jgi:hypothetical protein
MRTLGKPLIRSTAYWRLRREDLQFEAEVMLLQQREAAAEVGQIAVIRPADALAQRMAVPEYLLADAAQVGKLLLRLQLSVKIGIGHHRLADDAVREAVLVGDRLQPARLVERALDAPVGDDVHRLNDVLRRDVVDPFLDRVVAAQPEIFAVHARDRRVGQPRDVLAQPDVAVSVDHRTGGGGHGHSSVIARRRL